MDLNIEIFVYNFAPDFGSLDDQEVASNLFKQTCSSLEKLQSYLGMFSANEHNIINYEHPIHMLFENLNYYAHSYPAGSPNDSGVDSTFHTDTSDDSLRTFPPFDIADQGAYRLEWAFVNDDLPGNPPDTVMIDPEVFDIVDGQLVFKEK